VKGTGERKLPFHNGALIRCAVGRGLFTAYPRRCAAECGVGLHVLLLYMQSGGLVMGRQHRHFCLACSVAAIGCVA